MPFGLPILLALVACAPRVDPEPTVHFRIQQEWGAEGPTLLVTPACQDCHPHLDRDFGPESDWLTPPDEQPADPEGSGQDEPAPRARGRWDEVIGGSGSVRVGRSYLLTDRPLHGTEASAPVASVQPTP